MSDTEFYRFVVDGAGYSQSYISKRAMKGGVTWHKKQSRRWDSTAREYIYNTTYRYSFQKLEAVIEWDVRDGEYTTFVQTPRAELKWVDIDG
jgi:hypothetical protein